MMNKKKQIMTRIFFTGLLPTALELKVANSSPVFVVENPTCWICGRDHLTIHASMKRVDEKDGSFLPQTLKVKYVLIQIGTETRVEVPICEVCMVLVNKASKTKVSLFTELRGDDELSKDDT